MEEFEKNINENSEEILPEAEPLADSQENAVEVETSIDEVEGEVVETAPKKFDLKREITEWVQAIVIALVVAFLLKNYVMTLAKVEGASMEPTLETADRLYVNKVMYTPEKGDVVIFEPASAPGKPYIKRVIATPGDTLYIDFETGDVYVNGCDNLSMYHMHSRYKVTTVSTCRTCKYVVDITTRTEEQGIGG